MCMSWLVRCTITGALCVSLAGCAATTRSASDVTAGSARLNAAGRTDSTPAHYYFQYATAPQALGTGFGVQTPTRGPIRANVSGAGGSLLPFSEQVSGLNPNTTYYYRVCGGDGQTNGDVCAQTRSFTTPGGVVFNRPETYSWTVPSGVTRVQFDVFGAQGGSGAASFGPSVVGAAGPGALGAHVEATLALQPGETLTVVVGGSGGDSTSSAGGSGGSGGGGVGGDGVIPGGGGRRCLSTCAPAPVTRVACRVAYVVGGGGGGASVWISNLQAPPAGAKGGAGGAIGTAGQDGSCFSDLGPCSTPMGGGAVPQPLAARAVPATIVVMLVTVAPGRSD